MLDDKEKQVIMTIITALNNGLPVVTIPDCQLKIAITNDLNKLLKESQEKKGN